VLYELRTTNVLVDQSTSIIRSVVDYKLDIGAIPTGVVLRAVQWTDEFPLDKLTLVGKIWKEDGTTEVAPIIYTWEDIRRLRDTQLSLTDWTQVTDAPLAAEQVQNFAVWRQQLRALPQMYATPEEAHAQYELLVATKP